MGRIFHQPHDKLFVKSMECPAHAIEIISNNVPKQYTDLLEFNTFQNEDTSYISRNFKTYRADSLCSFKMGRTRAYFYFLCEHQSTVDELMAFRVLVYTTEIMQKHMNQKRKPKNELPLVYPIIVYSGKPLWNASLDIFKLFGEQESIAREFLFKPAKLIDIHRIDDEVLKQQLLSGLTQYVLKHHFTKNIKDRVFFILNRMVELDGELGPGYSEYGSFMIEYVLERGKSSDEPILDEINRKLNKTLRGDVMSIREKWELDARQEGIKECARTTAVNLLKNGAEESLVKSSIELSDDEFDEILKETSCPSKA